MSVVVADRASRADAFTFEHFQVWSRRLVVDTGDPLELDVYQEKFCRDLFEGRPENWLIVPEGNGKTTLIAALSLYGLRFAEDALIPVAASSRDQARIMYRQAKGFLRRSKLSDPGFEFEAFDGYRRIDLRGPGRTKRGEVLGSIEIHAADAGTGDGIIPFPFAFLDELHRHRTLDLYLTWSGKLGKRGAQIVAISTAGEPGSDFEEARERIRQGAPIVEHEPGFVRCRSERVSFHEYALEVGGDPLDFEAVKRCNPLPSITVDSLRSKRSSETMTAAHWSRFVCNLATRSSEAAIAEIEWHNAATAERPPVGADIWVGFDVGFQHDTTALVPLWWESSEKRVLLPAVVLEPPGGGEQLDVREIRQAFLGLRDLYPGLSTVVMDSSRAEDIAAWLSDELGLSVVYRAQTAKPQAEDFERFMAALRQGWLLHSGDEALRRHALNAVAKLLLDGGSRFGRVSESRSGQNHLRVIDALIAAAMVHSYAVESRESVAWVI